MNKFFGLIVTGALIAVGMGVATSLPVMAATPTSNSWANSVTSTHPIHGNPNAALGSAETGRYVYGSPLYQFYSLGRAGDITLEFAQPIHNGPGNDIIVYETSPVEAALEQAQVYASSDGTNFTFIGTATNAQKCGCYGNTSALDLGPLTSARFLKLVDIPSGDSGVIEGFDLNAIQALYTADAVTPSPTPTSTPTPTPTATPKPQCSDAIDNDGDGKIDYPADSGCKSLQDNDESDNPECSDGKDNDGDGFTDDKDPGCYPNSDMTKQYNPDDDDETNGQCSDKKDNDKDGKIDRKDEDCHTDGNPKNDDSFDGDLNERTKVKAAVVKVAQITPVAVTAKTGAGSAVAVAITLLGASGLAITRKLAK